MSKKIIFLESATKRKTIQNFLGPEYYIFATSGHLLELGSDGEFNLGVNLNNFEPNYQVMPYKKKLIDYWKNFIDKEKIEEFYLATDPDREGEAIAQEIISLLKLKKGSYKRLLFFEITKDSITKALAEPTVLDEKLVSAQLSRQVLDKMMGFMISGVLSKSLSMRNISAGRVQSVVLKLLVDKEKIILKQEEKPKRYIVEAYSSELKKSSLILVENSENEEKYSKLIFSDLSKLKTTVENFNKRVEFKLKHVYSDSKKENILPNSPFTTSSLLFLIRKETRINVKEATKVLQKLYEGIKIKSGFTCLITYPRTDSIRVNEVFQKSIYFHIEKLFKKENFNFTPYWKNKKVEKHSQNAHESIHPTNISITPDSIKDYLSDDEYKIYKLIYDYTITSFMNNIVVSNDNHIFVDNENNYFSYNEKVVVKKGFLIYDEKFFLKKHLLKLETKIKDIKKEITVEKVNGSIYIEREEFRYNEGDIIKTLEKLGIGRPSTYNTFSSIILKRKYAFIEKNRFVPSELGKKVNSWLQLNFPNLINEKYTATLEQNLDDISKGKEEYYSFISNFWKVLMDRINQIKLMN